jgi:hypothetical protein
MVTLCLVPPDAAAQFGSIFGDPPLRPPASVPGGRQQVPQPLPQQQQPQFPDRLPPGPPPSARRSQPQIQTEPLPPPGGGQQQQAAPSLPPGVRPPRGTPAPAVTTPLPGDEVVAAPPSQKIPNQQAVFSGLDKITGRIISFDVTIGETVQFGALQVVPRVCYTRPPTESAATDSFVEVSEVTLQGEVRRIFSGWMFAASPGLNAVEHPIYDVWLTDCKQPLVRVAEDPAPGPRLGMQGPPSPNDPQPVQDGDAPQDAPAAAAPPRQPAAPRPRPQQQQTQPQPQDQPPPQQRPRPQPQQQQARPRPPQGGGGNPFPTPIR